MRIAYAIPVRHIEALQDGTFMAIGIESNIFVVPAAAPAFILPMLISVAASPIESTGEPSHTLRLRVLGPDMAEVLPPLVMPFGMAPGPNTPEGWEVRSVVPLAVNVPVADAGTFSVEVSADEASLSVPIIVRLVEQPPS